MKIVQKLKSKLNSYGPMALLALMAAIPAAQAAYPQEWGLNMQDAAATSAEHIHHFHDFMIYVITAITLFVLALLVWVVVRYNRHVNPTPSNVAHNTLIEVIWTAVPVVILAVICLQSIPLLYYTDRTENPDMTIKITGYQWYWGYEYPDHGNVSFMANMIPDADINVDAGQKRKLSTDNIVVLPVGKNIAIQTTAADVLHAWTIPAFGVKKDSVPGRLLDTWVHITKPGVITASVRSCAARTMRLCRLKCMPYPPSSLTSGSRRPRLIWKRRMPLSAALR
ncbi:MAG TPA: cytochrome c oxidase subunit II transmembrane domain-containing protein [Alphaproteobacteria bacterium]|nr:cytochrome c oxidase subunit II transmembrane domain-containing protein [Alphaproteobacteria bacterium]